MATPNQMPKKANPLHQQILSALLSNPVRRVPVAKGSAITRPVGTLANNVSEENIERAARRWIK
ncbi:hypothetical protein SEA_CHARGERPOWER_63 [Mycobacterium phage Chargerpower]|nr:hypothetical protein SEA_CHARGERPOWER_63 [Mycobacterium phage Chargerpower]